MPPKKKEQPKLNVYTGTLTEFRGARGLGVKSVNYIMSRREARQVIEPEGINPSGCKGLDFTVPEGYLLESQQDAIKAPEPLLEASAISEAIGDDTNDNHEESSPLPETSEAAEREDEVTVPSAVDDEDDKFSLLASRIERQLQEMTERTIPQIIKNEFSSSIVQIVRQELIGQNVASTVRFKESVDSLNDMITALQTNVQGLQTSFNLFREDSQRAAEERHAVTDKLTRLEDAFSNQSKEVEALKETVPDLISRIYKLEQQPSPTKITQEIERLNSIQELRLNRLVEDRMSTTLQSASEHRIEIDQLHSDMMYLNERVNEVRTGNQTCTSTPNQPPAATPSMELGRFAVNSGNNPTAMSAARVTDPVNLNVPSAIHSHTPTKPPGMNNALPPWNIFNVPPPPFPHPPPTNPHVAPLTFYNSMQRPSTRTNDNVAALQDESSDPDSRDELSGDRLSHRTKVFRNTQRRNTNRRRSRRHDVRRSERRSDEDPESDPQEYEERRSGPNNRRRIQERDSQKLMPRPKKYDGSTNFDSYEVQFNTYAEEAGWDERRKLKMFAILVDGKALDYFVANRPRGGRYNTIDEVFSKFRRRFGRTELPQSLRNEFQQMRQKSEESVEDWADRVQSLAYDAFPGMNEAFITEETVRRFCQGLVDKDAAAIIGCRLPRNLSDAIHSVKEYKCNHKAVFGQAKKIRSVTFEEEHTPTVRRLEKEDVKNIVRQELADVRRMLTEFAKSSKEPPKKVKIDTTPKPFNSPPRARQGSPGRSPSPVSRSPSPRKCFNCKQEGHFSRECLSPKRQIICYKCSKEGHISRDCPGSPQSPSNSSLNSNRSK